MVRNTKGQTLSVAEWLATSGRKLPERNRLNEITTFGSVSWVTNSVAESSEAQFPVPDLSVHVSDENRRLQKQVQELHRQLNIVAVDRQALRDYVKCHIGSSGDTSSSQVLMGPQSSGIDEECAHNQIGQSENNDNTYDDKENRVSLFSTKPGRVNNNAEVSSAEKECAIMREHNIASHTDKGGHILCPAKKSTRGRKTLESHMADPAATSDNLIHSKSAANAACDKDCGPMFYAEKSTRIRIRQDCRCARENGGTASAYNIDPCTFQQSPTPLPAKRPRGVKGELKLVHTVQETEGHTIPSKIIVSCLLYTSPSPRD